MSDSSSPDKRSFLSRLHGLWLSLLIKVGWDAIEHQHPEKDFLPKEIVETYKEIYGRIDYHIDVTRHRSLLYHHLSRILMWATPILSGILTVFIGEYSNGSPKQITFYLSCAVTILTAMNSTIHPFEVALSAEKYSNEFWKFHTDLELEIERAYKDTEGNDKERYKRVFQLLTNKNRELCTLIEHFNQSPSFEIRVKRASARQGGGSKSKNNGIPVPKEAE